MSVTLATAWNPRGELARFQRLYDRLCTGYDSIVVTLPPDVDTDVVSALEAMDSLHVELTPTWPWGRYLALKTALVTDADHIHYADFDRLLRWVETKPEEWRRSLAAIQEADCLVFGRTKQAWETHPQALRQTEAISNAVFSHLMGLELDLSAGSKGFSRTAVEVLMANTAPERALGADSEWIVILHRSGFKIQTLLVEGLDWETADRHQNAAAKGDQQRQAALRYDEDAQHWAMRIAVAKEIVEAGLDAMQRPLKL